MSKKMLSIDQMIKSARIRLREVCPHSHLKLKDIQDEDGEIGEFIHVFNVPDGQWENVRALFDDLLENLFFASDWFPGVQLWTIEETQRYFPAETRDAFAALQIELSNMQRKEIAGGTGGGGYNSPALELGKFGYGYTGARIVYPKAELSVAVPDEAIDLVSFSHPHATLSSVQI